MTASNRKIPKKLYRKDEMYSVYRWLMFSSDKAKNHRDSQEYGDFDSWSNIHIFFGQVTAMKTSTVLYCHVSLNNLYGKTRFAMVSINNVTMSLQRCVFELCIYFNRRFLKSKETLFSFTIFNSLYLYNLAKLEKMIQEKSYFFNRRNLQLKYSQRPTQYMLLHIKYFFFMKLREKIFST